MDHTRLFAFRRDLRGDLHEERAEERGCVRREMYARYVKEKEQRRLEQVRRKEQRQLDAPERIVDYVREQEWIKRKEGV